MLTVVVGHRLSDWLITHARVASQWTASSSSPRPEYLDDDDEESASMLLLLLPRAPAAL
jgi:hypothetical protein